MHFVYESCLVKLFMTVLLLLLVDHVQTVLLNRALLSTERSGDNDKSEPTTRCSLRSSTTSLHNAL